MFFMAMAIRNVETTLPGLVYALLSGLNSAIIGIIAGAALDLAKRAIINKMTLVLVYASGAFAI